MKHFKRIMSILVVVCILSVSTLSFADAHYSSTITLRTFTTGASATKKSTERWGRLMDLNSYIYYLDKKDKQSSCHEQYVQFVNKNGKALSDKKSHSQGYFWLNEDKLYPLAQSSNEVKIKVTNWYYEKYGSNTTYRLFCGGNIGYIAYSTGK